MMVSLIAAVSENDVIGRSNALIWHIPEDKRRFRELTMDHHIIMGRKSFESIGCLLPGRTSIVLTRRRDYSPPTLMEGTPLIAHSIEEALELCRDRGEGEAFIIGGGQIFRQSLTVAQRIYLTRIYHPFDGDVFFPKLGEEWHLISRQDRRERKPYAFGFMIYEKLPLTQKGSSD